MDEEEQALLEAQARALFKEIYPPAYLNKLANDSTANRDLVELLWAGFVNGFFAGHQANGQSQA